MSNVGQKWYHSGSNKLIDYLWKNEQGDDYHSGFEQSDDTTWGQETFLDV